MGGVDRLDQNVSTYRTNIRIKKWWFPYFAHMLEASLQNAWLLYRENNSAMTLLQFRRSVAARLLQSADTSTNVEISSDFVQSIEAETVNRGRPSASSSLQRRPLLGHVIQSSKTQKRCRHCKQKTYTLCKACCCGLHQRCFEVYHETEL